jgi:hypothetical protein
MKARKSSSILAVTGSSGDSPSTCFTITLNANCASPRTETTPHQRKREKKTLVSQSHRGKRFMQQPAAASNNNMTMHVGDMHVQRFSLHVSRDHVHATMLMTDRLREQPNGQYSC